MPVSGIMTSSALNMSTAEVLRVARFFTPVYKIP